MIFDIHCHSEISPCSNIPLHDLIRHAKDVGLHGLCITDHHSMDALQYLKEGPQENGLFLIVGTEYSTTQGDFLVFGPKDLPPPGLTALQLIDAVEKEGGVCIAAHPFREKRPLDISLVEDHKVKVVETWNGRNTYEENLRAIMAFSGNGVRLVSGSDAHTIEEIGTSATEFTMPILTKEDFIYAIKKGLTLQRTRLK